MITLLVLTCLNVNSGWFCGNTSHELSYSGTATYEDVTYVEVENPTMEGVVEVLYGTQSKPSTIAERPRKQGCYVRTGGEHYVSSKPCSKIRKHR